jgi:hypothetical protein
VIAAGRTSAEDGGSVQNNLKIERIAAVLAILATVAFFVFIIWVAIFS